MVVKNISKVTKYTSNMYITSRRSVYMVVRNRVNGGRTCLGTCTKLGSEK